MFYVANKFIRKRFFIQCETLKLEKKERSLSVVLDKQIVQSVSAASHFAGEEVVGKEGFFWTVSKKYYVPDKRIRLNNGILAKSVALEDYFLKWNKVKNTLIKIMELKLN